MEAAGIVLGVAGLAFQFFHVGKQGFKILGEIGDASRDGKLVQLLLRVQRQR